MFFCDCTPHLMCDECNVLHCTFHAPILCQSEICVGLCQFWATNFTTIAAAVACAVVVAADDATYNTRPGVLICRKRYAVPPQNPQNVDGQLRNDQEFCNNLQGELKKTNLWGVHNESHRGGQTETYRH